MEKRCEIVREIDFYVIDEEFNLYSPAGPIKQDCKLNILIGFILDPV
jgi:hypothetical protein